MTLLLHGPASTGATPIENYCLIDENRRAAVAAPQSWEVFLVTRRFHFVGDESLRFCQSLFSSLLTGKRG